MAVLATVFGILGRFAGKLLTMSLGWASTLLFGRVSRDRQVLLAVVTFGAIVWAVVAFAVVWPDGGAFLLALAPIPPWVDEGWVRLAMLAGAVVIPPVLGAVTLGVLPSRDRPEGVREMAVSALRGYPLAAALATMLAFLAAIGLGRKAGSLLRRWTDAHIPIVVKPGAYRRLATDLVRAISDADIEVDIRPAPAVLVVPGRLLGLVAGPHVRGLIPDRLVRLVGRDLEVLVYPSDVAIAGRQATVARVQAALASRLTTAEAWLTATAEGQAIEDRLAQIADGQTEADGRAAALARIDEELATRDLPYDEWEVLYRERLQVERDLLAGIRPGERMPVASNVPTGGRKDDSGDPYAAPAPQRDLVGAGMAAAAIALLAADIALLVAGRLEMSRTAWKRFSRRGPRL